MPYPYAQQMTPTAYYPTPSYAQPTISTNSPSNGLIWVQGETGAKSYLVAPNTTVLLMDSETQKFYIKSADSSGMPMPLRVFEYKEMGGAETMNAEKYVTREEFDRRISALLKKEGSNE